MKGKRYSDAQKQEVVSFVEKHNEDNGRGGQSAASAKFGVSQLTIAGWLKNAGSPSASKKGKAAKAPKAPKAAKAGKTTRKYTQKSADVSSPVSGDFSSKLRVLLDLGNQIQKGEKELDQLKSRFNSLKSSL